MKINYYYFFYFFGRMMSARRAHKEYKLNLMINFARVIAFSTKNIIVLITELIELFI